MQAKDGDLVKVHYTGTLKDGAVFDTSEQREPLEFTLGKKQVIPGFEQAVIGMLQGDSKTVTIPVDQAYGPYRTELIFAVDLEQWPGDFEPQVDQQLELRQETGQAILVTVTDITESTVTLDGNHPLAGEDLTFKIQLMEVN